MLRIFAALSVLLLFCLGAVGQSQTFRRHGLEYTLELPSPSWIAVSRVDVHQHFEFVNGDYSNGYLRVRKKFVTSGTTTRDLFSHDEKWELQNLPGYIVCSACEGTDFNGQLRGAVFSYEFVHQGTKMSGLLYYLQVDNRTFYALHFTVAKEKLGVVRDQIDSIAQSFRLKRGF